MTLPLKPKRTDLDLVAVLVAAVAVALILVLLLGCSSGFEAAGDPGPAPTADEPRETGGGSAGRFSLSGAGGSPTGSAGGSAGLSAGGLYQDAGSGGSSTGGVTSETGGAQAAGGSPGNGGAAGYQAAAGGSPQAGGNVGAGGAPTNCGKPGHAGTSSPGDPSCNRLTCAAGDAACFAVAWGCTWFLAPPWDDCAAVRFQDGSYAEGAWVCPAGYQLPGCQAPPPGAPNHEPGASTQCCPLSAMPVKP